MPRKMFLIGQNLKHIYMTFYSWTIDLFLINSRYLVFEVSEEVVREVQRCSKDALKNFAKFTGKHLWQSLFSNKVANRMVATVLKKRLWHRCFTVDFAKRSPVAASEDYFSSHQRNIVYEYKLHGKPTMK